LKKSKKRPNQSQLKARTFSARTSLNANYARLKNELRLTLKPPIKKAVQKARKVGFFLFSAFDVLLRQRNRVGSLAHRLSARALSPASSGLIFHLKKYVFFLLTHFESIRILSDVNMNKRISKEKQALVLAALCEGAPIEAVARILKASTNTVTRIIRETGEAFAAYMAENFRDLPCSRIEMDEQWQYVGCHAGRMIKKVKGKGDYWLWACIDADTKLIISHKIGKRDYWTGYDFVKSVRERVRGPVQIATDNWRQYPFLIRTHFGYEGYSFGTETKIFGEPMLSDGTLAALGRNEGVRRLRTAERKPVVGSPDLGSLTTSHIERAFLSVRQELKRFQRKGLGFSKDLETHKRAVDLHFGVYNFVRVHKTLETTPAVAAGVALNRWILEDVVEMTEAYFRRKEDAAFEVAFEKAGL
jgi:IS1 family transposase